MNTTCTRRTFLQAATGAAAALGSASFLRARPAYEPTWDSLSNHPVPGWFADAKFGIFFHWGIYTVPAFDSEWYSRNMYIRGSARQPVSQPRLRAHFKVWLQGFHPDVSRGEIQSGGMGAAVSQGGRQIRGPGNGARGRLLPVGLEGE